MTIYSCQGIDNIGTHLKSQYKGTNDNIFMSSDR